MEEILDSGGQIYLVEIEGKEYLLAGYVEEEMEQNCEDRKQFDNTSKVFHIVEKTLPFTCDNVKLQEMICKKLGCAKFRFNELVYMIDTELKTDIYVSLALND